MRVPKYVSGVIILLGMLISHLYVEMLHAGHFYVSVVGNDDSSGSYDTPFASLQKALSVATGGDTIFIKAGTYNQGRIDINSIVTAPSQMLTIRNYSDDIVIIDHNDDSYGWWIESQHNILIKGLIIQNSTEGFTILGDSQNIIIQNCTVRNIKNRGVFSHGANFNGYPLNITIEESDFYNIGSDTVGADIALGRDATNFTIRNNMLRGNVDGVVIAGASSGHIIENNVIKDHIMEDGVDIKNCYKKTDLARSEYTIVRNNIIHGHVRQTGITVQMGSQNVIISNNKIYGNKFGIWIRSVDTGNVDINNNVIYSNASCGIVTSQDVNGNISIHNNIVYKNALDSTSDELKSGIKLLGGVNQILTNNVIANNSIQLSGVQLQVYLATSIMDSLKMDSNIYYSEPDVKVIRRGPEFYSINQFQIAFQQENTGQHLFGVYLFANDEMHIPSAPHNLQILTE